jgi:hypothetical protein
VEDENKVIEKVEIEATYISTNIFCVVTCESYLQRYMKIAAVLRR